MGVRDAGGDITGNADLVECAADRVFGEGREFDEDDDQHSIEDGGDIEDMYRVRLMASLLKVLV